MDDGKWEMEDVNNYHSQIDCTVINKLVGNIS
jgi:hypothetical protein